MLLKINLLSVFVLVRRVLLKVALVSWGSLHGQNTQCCVRGALSAAGAAVRYRLLGWKLNLAARAKCCGVSFLSAEPSSALGKRVAEPQKGWSMQVRLDWGNLWNAWSPRGVDPGVAAPTR